MAAVEGSSRPQRRRLRLQRAAVRRAGGQVEEDNAVEPAVLKELRELRAELHKVRSRVTELLRLRREDVSVRAACGARGRRDVRRESSKWNVEACEFVPKKVAEESVDLPQEQLAEEPLEPVQQHVVAEESVVDPQEEVADKPVEKHVPRRVMVVDMLVQEFVDVQHVDVAEKPVEKSVLEHVDLAEETVGQCMGLSKDEVIDEQDGIRFQLILSWLDGSAEEPAAPSDRITASLARLSWECWQEMAGSAFDEQMAMKAMAVVADVEASEPDAWTGGSKQGVLRICTRTAQGLASWMARPISASARSWQRR